MRDHAARRRVEHRHPDHEAGDGVGVAVVRKREAARERPQDADETRQRDHRVEQAHGEAHGVGGELVDVFGNPLVRVVGNRVLGLREASELQVVEGLVGEPAVEVVRRHPGAPFQLQQLGEVEAVDRDDDEAEREVGEAPELAPEHGGVLVLQRVVEHAVPLVDEYQHVDRAQVERHDGRQQTPRFPFLFQLEIGQGERADLGGELAEALEFVAECHGVLGMDPVIPLR
ncbi:hypothetical protein Y695_02692 [Hydrogenophaga sp. T4]|nr:hypothetical protein Y695_02692 [Hydrogenophaga sp. T4]